MRVDLLFLASAPPSRTSLRSCKLDIILSPLVKYKSGILPRNIKSGFIGMLVTSKADLLGLKPDLIFWLRLPKQLELEREA